MVLSQKELLFLDVDDAGDMRTDVGTNAVAELTENEGGNLTSVLTFASLEGSVHNNTFVECSTYNEESTTNLTIFMAGEGLMLAVRSRTSIKFNSAL